jgi:hypothetical protein
MHTIFEKALKGQNQGDIAFGDGFIKPVLLQEIRILRMPDKREMGMQDKSQRSMRHGT